LGRSEEQRFGSSIVSVEWQLGYTAPFGIPEKYLSATSTEKINIKARKNELGVELKAGDTPPSQVVD